MKEHFFVKKIIDYNNFVKKIIDYNNNNVIDVANTKLFHKIIFLFTNIIYFIPVIIYGINIPTCSIFLIGIISSIFHYQQCKNNCCHHKIKQMLWCDIIVVCVIGLIFWVSFIRFTNIYWYLISIISFGFFLIPTDVSKNLYMAAHGMWHLLTGCLFLYLIYMSKQNTIST